MELKHTHTHARAQDYNTRSATGCHPSGGKWKNKTNVTASGPVTASPFCFDVTFKVSAVLPQAGKKTEVRFAFLSCKKATTAGTISVGPGFLKTVHRIGRKSEIVHRVSPEKYTHKPNTVKQQT